MIAARMRKIDASGIRKVFDLAAQIKDPINLSIGQPDFDVPDAVKQAAIGAIADGFNRYTVTQGIPELRAALRDTLVRAGRLLSHSTADVTIASGTSGGLLLALLALVNPGDEVVVADPYFVMYKHLLNLFHATPVFASTYPDFRLTAARIEPVLTAKTKMVIINSPCNPSGAVSGADELKDIAALCNARGIWILSDEVYRSFCYDGPCASIFPLAERGLLLDGFSKSHAMTGWRIGFVAGPPEVIQEVNKLQQYTFVCAPSMAQKAALAALSCDMSSALASYRKKRDMVFNGLKDTFDLVKPGGAFYAFPAAPGGDATSFAKKALERKLLIIPGNVFSERDTHFRISYAATNATIERGLDVLRSLA